MRAFACHLTRLATAIRSGASEWGGEHLCGAGTVQYSERLVLQNMFSGKKTRRDAQALTIYLTKVGIPR